MQFGDAGHGVFADDRQLGATAQETFVHWTALFGAGVGKSMCATVTKLEAAHRQLAAAIRMYFTGGDAVAVHTLACAAREIYEKHCKQRNLDRMFEYIKTANSDRKETELWNVLNAARNFFKHPGESLDETIELHDADNKHVLFIACHDCAVLCGKAQPTEVQAFSTWFLATDFPLGLEGEQQTAADEILSHLDQRFPGLRTASLAEQKLAGLRLLEEAEQLERQQQN